LAQSSQDHQVRLHHFISALLSGETKERLRQFGYRDGDSKRQHRFNSMSSTTATFVRVQPIVLPPCDELQSWVRAAEELAEQRRLPEHRTITLEDFLEAVGDTAELQGKPDLQGIRKELEKYRDGAPVDQPFSAKVLTSLGTIQAGVKGVGDQVGEVKRRMEGIGTAVGGVAAEVRRTVDPIGKQVSSIEARTTDIGGKADALNKKVGEFWQELRTALNHVTATLGAKTGRAAAGEVGLHQKMDRLLEHVSDEVSLGRFAIGSLIVSAMVLGAVVGALFRMNFGPL
jgi:hypothetical protein